MSAHENLNQIGFLTNKQVAFCKFDWYLSNDMTKKKRLLNLAILYDRTNIFFSLDFFRSILGGVETWECNLATACEGRFQTQVKHY